MGVLLLGYIYLISCVSLVLACGSSSGVISTNIGCQFVKSRESASGNWNTMQKSSKVSLDPTEGKGEHQRMASYVIILTGIIFW